MLLIVSISIIFARYTILSSAGEGTDKNTIGTADKYSQIYFGKEVAVSAVVPSHISYKYIHTGKNNKYYLLMGNYEGGFVFVGDDNGKAYNFKRNEMPGDGVIIKIPNEVENLILLPYY